MKIIIQLLFVLVFCVQLPFYSSAQNYQLDNSFLVPYNFANNQSGVSGGQFTNGGKILLTGDFDDANYPFTSNIMMINHNGSVYSGFSHAPYFIQDGIVSAAKTTENDYIYNWQFISIEKIDSLGQHTDTLWNSSLNSILNGHTCYLPDVVHTSHFFMGSAPIEYPVNSGLLHCFVKVLPNGILDTTFMHNTDFPRPVYKIIDYDSSKILLAGWFRTYDNVQTNYLCRIDTLGNIDTTFHNIFSTNMQFYGSINQCYVQPDGKIIVAGMFRVNNLPDTLGLVRVLPNGYLDSTFNNYNHIKQFDLNTGCNTICPTTDGGYLIGGWFTSYQNRPRSHIAKIDANGYLDTLSFSGFGIDSVPALIPVQPDVTCILRDTGSFDRYYVMGHFYSYNGQSVNPIIRINGLNVGIAENSRKEEILLFPNPAHNYCELQFPANKIRNLIVYSLDGKTIKRQVESRIDLTELAQGLYVIQIIDTNGVTYHCKLVKD